MFIKIKRTRTRTTRVRYDSKKKYSQHVNQPSTSTFSDSVFTYLFGIYLLLRYVRRRRIIGFSAFCFSCSLRMTQRMTLSNITIIKYIQQQHKI